MPLPKIDLPVYEVFIPSLDRNVQFRPFIVKEEKILLIALESNDFNTILTATKQVIQNCILSEGIDVDDLPLNEIELLFLNLRARSMGETIELNYVCENMIDDKKCKGQVNVVVDLLKVSIENKQVKNTINLTNEVGIKLKFPTINVSGIINNKDSGLDETIELIEKCTEYLFDSEQVYKPSEMAAGEFKEFITNLTQNQYLMIQEFFSDIPKVQYSTKATCTKCKKDHDIFLEGLLDFFE
jgi:hypothetical protein